MPTTRINGIQLHYDVAGSGPALLLIHGLGSSGLDWEHQVPEFARDHRVVTFDLRGHGRSGRPPGPYSIAQFAGDAALLLEELGAAPAHVVGLSLGGAIAFQLALDRPALVRSLTIVNSGPHAVLDTLAARFAIGLRYLMLRLFALPKLGAAIAKKLFPKAEHAPLRATFAERFARNDKASYRAALDALIGWSVRERLGELKVPVLALTADQDYTPVSLKEEYVKRIAGARLVVVPDTHHALPIENPPAFNAALRQFLAGAAK